MDWSKLKPYRSNKNKSLEQLCFQIACKLYVGQGTFTEIDDSGGGDGVEFYLTKEDGTVVGWQAKFYENSPRLKDGGRKEAILSSYKKACKVHPTLSHWYLCTNSKFTPDEQRWFESKVQTSVLNSTVVIEHWSEGKIKNWLDEPKFIGLKNAFFNDLELSNEWFQKRFDEVSHLVKDKFVKSLHTKDSDLFKYYINPILLNREYVDYFKSYRDEIVNDLNKFQATLKSFNTEKYYAPNYPQVSYILKNAQQVLLENVEFVNNLLYLFENKKIKDISKAEGKKRIHDLGKCLTDLNDIKYNLLTPSPAEDNSVSSKKDDLIDKIVEEYYGLHNNFERLYDIYLKQNYSSLNILGDAGIGKTHICTSIAIDYLEAQLPVIFIPAKIFTSNSQIKNQILQHLDIKSEYSFDELLATLNSLGEINKVRIPILIDGINESVDDNGRFLQVWKKELPILEQNLTEFENVVLITTCRSSYVQHTWGIKSERLDSRFITYRGMNKTEDLKKLVQLYFKEYRIHTDYFLLNYSYFQSPIFLKIFCATKSRQPDVTYVTINDDTFYEVIEKYFYHLDVSIKKRLEDELNFPYFSSNIKDIASSSCEKLGKYLWTNNTRSIQLEDALKIVDYENTEYHTSKFRFLLEEGLLFVKDALHDDEIIAFTYDLIAGYCVALYLISEYKNNFPSLINSKDFNTRLFSKKKFHPLFEDILKCFTILLPRHGDNAMHLYEYYNHHLNAHRKQSFSYSILQFFKISGNFIRERHINLSEELFDNVANQQLFLQNGKETFFNDNHPLNFQFFSRQLKKMELIDRDILWLEFIRVEYRQPSKELLTNFENEIQAREKHEINKTHWGLFAQFAVWILSSNLLHLREMAARALYHYGRKYPDLFFDLVKEYASSNDPYITEKLCAISFGIVEALENNEINENFLRTQLPLWSNFFYCNFFAKNAPYGTTHIHTREYLIKVISKALKYNNISSIDPDNIKHHFKFGGIRKWKTAEDRNEKDYKDGNALFDYYFLKDGLYGIAPGDIYHRNEKREKVINSLRWRVYQLGYDFEKFKYLDQTLARHKHYPDNDGIQRYADKYVDIAVQEYSGYLQDMRKLLGHYGESPYPFYKKAKDPTLPLPLPKKNFYKKDILGDVNMDMEKWLLLKQPDMSELLLQLIYQEIKDMWVLLEATICQTDESANKQVNLHISSLLSKHQEYKRTYSAFANKNFIDQLCIPDNTIDLYCSEIPFSELLADISNVTMRYVSSSKEIIETHDECILLVNEQRLSKHEIDQLWNDIERQYNIILAGYVRIENDKIVFPPVITNKKSAVIEVGEIFNKYNITFKKETVYSKKKLDNTRSVHVEMPLIRTIHGNCLAKKIALTLDLINQPQTLDMFDKNRQRATISFHFGDQWLNNQKFTYMRKDLLETYLHKTQQKLFWYLQGERRVYMTWGRHIDLNIDSIQRFKEVFPFNHS
jgi:hypothetical protein